MESYGWVSCVNRNPVREYPEKKTRFKGDFRDEVSLFVGVFMNKIKRNAEAYKNLLDVVYYYCLTDKGKGFEVQISFSKEQFHHLEEIGQLSDLPIHSISGEQTFNRALQGLISEEYMQKSEKFNSNIQKKIDFLYLLEKAFDNNDIIFRYKKDKNNHTCISAELLLCTDVDGNSIYVYIDKVHGQDIDYFCRSFVVNPSDDRTSSQKILTVLWKEKRNAKEQTSEVLYQFKDFEPKQLNNNNESDKTKEKPKTEGENK